MLLSYLPCCCERSTSITWSCLSLSLAFDTLIHLLHTANQVHDLCNVSSTSTPSYAPTRPDPWVRAHLLPAIRLTASNKELLEQLLQVEVGGVFDLCFRFCKILKGCPPPPDSPTPFIVYGGST